MTVDDIPALVGSHPTMALNVAVAAGLAVLLLVANRLRTMTAHRATLLVANILTVLAAALATMVSASGMWKFFTDILGPSPLRVVFFAYIEVALFASALLARTRLLRDPQNGSTGIDGIAVWIFAALTASLSSLDADSFSEICLRLIAPLVAAWMWERALAAERHARLSTTTTGIHWAITLERVLVWLRLAEAHGRDLTDIDRARRRARLGRARLNLYLLQNKKTAAWRVRRAHHKVIRQAMQAAEHIGLAGFPHAADERQAIQMYMATLYGFVDATTPEAVVHLNAWRSVTIRHEPNGTTLVTAPDRAAAHSADNEQLPAMPHNSIPLPALAPHKLNGHTSLVDPDDSILRTAAPQDGPDDTQGQNQQAHRHSDPGDDGPDSTGDVCGRAAAPWTPEPSRPDDRPPMDEIGDRRVDQVTDNDSDTSVVAAMRRFWDNEIALGRIPTGAELSRAAGVPPTTGQGRRKRREWKADLPDHLKAAVGTRR